MSTSLVFPFDSTGLSPKNLVENELRVVLPPAGIKDQSFIVPNAAAFFGSSLVIKDSPNATGRVLREHVDYELSHYSVAASLATGKPCYGSITFIDRYYTGNVYLTYRSVGGDFSRFDHTWVEQQTKERYAMRHVTFDQIVGVPSEFPSDIHTHKPEDMVGLSELATGLTNIAEAIREANRADVTTFIAQLGNHLSSTGTHSPSQVGLGNVFNYKVATAADIDSQKFDRYVTAGVLSAWVNAKLTALANTIPAAANLTNYYTKSEANNQFIDTTEFAQLTYNRTQIEDKIAQAIANSSIDLTSYAKKTDLTPYAKTTDVQTIMNQALAGATVDLTGYVKTTDLNPYAKTVDLAPFAKTVDLASYAKTTDLATYAKNIDLAPYAKTVDLVPYAKTTQLAPYAKTVDLAPYAKTADVQTMISQAFSAATGTSVDLTGYVRTIDLVPYVKTEDLTPYVKTVDLDPYVKTVDLASYAKTTDLATYVKNVDLAPYAKTVDLAPYVKTVDLAPFAKTADLAPYAKTVDLAPFAKTADLTGYAKTTDLAPFARTTDLAAYVKTTELTPYAKTADVQTSITTALSDYVPTFTIVNKTSNYTVAAGDLNGKTIIRCGNASGIVTITLPQTTATVEVGTQIHIRRVGAGDVTVAPASGVTIIPSDSLLLRRIGTTATFIKIDNTTWDCITELV